MSNYFKCIILYEKSFFFTNTQFINYIFNLYGVSKLFKLYVFYPKFTLYTFYYSKFKFINSIVSVTFNNLNNNNMFIASPKIVSSIIYNNKLLNAF